MDYFKVKNFDKYQPKRNGKNAPWIRLHHNWNHDSAIGQLHDSHKAHWVGLLCIAHTENNQIPYDPVWIKKRGCFSSNVKLELFEKLGLIEIISNKSVSDGKSKKPLVSKLDIKQGDIPVACATSRATLIDFYYDEFVRVFNKKPLISGGKDGAILKRVSGTYGDDQTRELVTKFIESNDPWIVDTGRSLEAFAASVQKLLVGGTKSRKGFTKI